MKLYILIESNSSIQLKNDNLKYILRQYSDVSRLKSKFLSRQDNHNGTFCDTLVRCQGVAFSLCSQSHSSSSKCREKNKIVIFENGNEFRVSEDAKIDELLDFCRDISMDEPSHIEKENHSGKHKCVPFLRLCDMFSNFISRTVIPDAESNKCCIVIAKSPKGTKVDNHFFADEVKWSSNSSYRNLCTCLNFGLQYFTWIDTNGDVETKSCFLDNLMQNCKGMYININDIINPLVPLSTVMHNFVNSEHRGACRKKHKSIPIKNRLATKIHSCRLSGIGSLPTFDVTLVELDTSRTTEKYDEFPRKLDFDCLVNNVSMDFPSVDIGKVYIVKPLSSSSVTLKALSEMMSDKNVSIVFKEVGRKYVAQTLRISSGSCLVLHSLSDQFFTDVPAPSHHRSHPLISSYPFSILEPWRKVEALPKLISIVQKPRLVRLEGLLSSARRHDQMKSPCRPCVSPPKRICSPDGPTLMLRSEEELRIHVLRLYHDALHAGHTALRLATSVRHIVATVHRFSRYHNRDRPTENKSWSISFVDEHLKKDSEIMKTEHNGGPDKDNILVLLTEFQLQILIAFEVNALEITEMESEPNCQLVDWASDIMQTYVMLSPNRQRWREFLHVSLVDAYHSILGLSLVLLFEELGQDPPACLPEQMESDKSMVEMLSGSFHEEETERTATSPASSIGRWDSLSRPDLGDQASQSSNVIQLTPHKKSNKLPRKRRVSGSRTRVRRKSGQSSGRFVRSPAHKKRRIARSKEKPLVICSPLKTPTKGATLVVKGTPAHKSGQPRWERARKKALEKSRGRIVVEESPQKPAGREFRRLRRVDSSSQGFEKGEAWKVAMEDHEISLSQFVEINGLDFDSEYADNTDSCKDVVVLYQASDSQSRRHSNLFANIQDSPSKSTRESTIPFSPPRQASSPVKLLRTSASPTKSILRTPVKGANGFMVSPVKLQQDKRRVLMSPRVRRRTFSGNEPADAFLDEGTMFLDVNEFTQLSATPDDVGLRAPSDSWQSPKRREETANSVRNSVRVCRRLFVTPEKRESIVPSFGSSPVPQSLRRRLVFSKELKDSP